MGTGDHSPIYSKQYPASNYDQEIKFQETQKLLERGQIEESTSPWSSPIDEKQIDPFKSNQSAIIFNFCFSATQLNE